MELSNRLKAIADMVTVGNRVADVGCDHGFVSIYLCEKKISPKVYAMDVRKGPLMRAIEHVEAYGYGSYIECRLSDGVANLKAGEADTLICAGMGGRLMAKILTDGMEKIKMMQELILQPQSDLAFFRGFLRENGFAIVKEDMVKEDGKYYPMMRVLPDSAYTEGGFPVELEDAYGPCLLKMKHPVLGEYLKTLYQRNEGILVRLGEAGEDRRQELLREQEGIRFCLSYCTD